MSITLYSRYRRMKLRNAWQLAGMSKTVGYILIGLGILLAAYATVQAVENHVEERIHEHKAKEEKAHKLLAHVLNGRAIIDKATGAAFFFQVSKQEGL